MKIVFVFLLLNNDDSCDEASENSLENFMHQEDIPCDVPQANDREVLTYYRRIREVWSNLRRITSEPPKIGHLWFLFRACLLVVHSFDEPTFFVEAQVQSH